MTERRSFRERLLEQHDPDSVTVVDRGRGRVINIDPAYEPIPAPLRRRLRRVYKPPPSDYPQDRKDPTTAIERHRARNANAMGSPGAAAILRRAMGR